MYVIYGIGIFTRYICVDGTLMVSFSPPSLLPSSPPPLPCQVYAPMTRIGVFLDSTAHRYQISSHYRDTLHGLLELEAGLPASMTQLRYIHPSIHVKECKKSTKALTESLLAQYTAYVYVHTYDCMYMCTYVHTYICMYVCMYVRT